MFNLQNQVFLWAQESQAYNLVLTYIESREATCPQPPLNRVSIFIQLCSFGAVSGSNCCFSWDIMLLQPSETGGACLGGLQVDQVRSCERPAAITSPLNIKRRWLMLNVHQPSTRTTTYLGAGGGSHAGILDSAEGMGA